MRALPVTTAAFLLLSACAYGPTVRTDFDPAANFQHYRSYSWIQPSVPQGMNPLMFARLQGSIDRALQARGYTPATPPTPGDFAVAFTVGERDRVRVYDWGPSWGGWGWGSRWGGWGWGGWGPGWGGWGPGWGSDIDVDQYLERSIVIDVYDNVTKRPVWHGVASNSEYSGEVNYAKLDQAVVAALAKFPPQPPEGTP